MKVDDEDAVVIEVFQHRAEVDLELVPAAENPVGEVERAAHVGGPLTAVPGVRGMKHGTFGSGAKRSEIVFQPPAERVGVDIEALAAKGLALLYPPAQGHRGAAEILAKMEGPGSP